MQQLNARLTFFILKAISWLPFPVLYLLSDLLFVIFYHITGYRKKVVYSNLKASFPNKSEKEINAIAKKFYQHLADLMLESIKSFSISEKQISKRVQIEQEIVKEYRKKGQSVIVVFGHYCNWEWFGLSSSAQLDPKLYALYRKIKNPVLNELIRKNRGRFGLGLIPEKEAYKTVGKVLNDDQWCLVGFIADQAVSPKRAYWIDFLNQKTTFVKGPEKYGKMTNSPIIFFDLQKVKRGYYKGHSELLVANPTETADEEIMTAFAKRIEQQITAEPAYWLWSHKRWKHQYKSTEDQ